MSKVKVSKIKIEIGKKSIELSLEEAHELQEILNSTFGKREVKFIPSYAPIIIERPVYPRPWRCWDVTWKSNTMYLLNTQEYRGAP